MFMDIGLVFDPKQMRLFPNVHRRIVNKKIDFINHLN